MMKSIKRKMSPIIHLMIALQKSIFSENIQNLVMMDPINPVMRITKRDVLTILLLHVLYTKVTAAGGSWSH